jgi:hypothetical protein
MTKQELLKVTPEQLHKWYLEATKELDPHFFNLKAQVPYEDLHDKQKWIDKDIADKINALLSLPSVEGATEEEIKHILWDNSGNTPNLTQAGVNQFAKALLGKIPTTKEI